MGPDPRVGTDLGSYHIESLVGRGGMGVVYRAVDRGLDRPVALKLIAPTVADDEAFRSRFLRESKMAAAIDHPSILPVYEAGETDGVFFLATRYVDGTDLEHRLREGPIEPRAAVAILGQVASALDAAHGAGLVHRDVKPANVLIASGQGADRSDHAYLTDFGLTKQSGAETGLTRVGGFVGTLEYIAPEQIEGKAVDGRADQYALAAIAVTCLTGRVPFPRDSDVALINAHLHEPPPSIHLRQAELPMAVDAVIARGMAKDPAARYPDCRAFVEDLRDALGVSATHSRALPASTEARDRRIPLVVAGLLAVGILAVLGFAFASGGSSSPSASPGASLAALSPSSSVEASPTEDVYPNVAEAALLARLPDAVKTACVRGPYEVVDGDNPIGGGRPIASVTCTPAITSGANEVVIRAFTRSTGTGGAIGNSGFTPDSGISAIEGRLNLKAGECSTSRRAGDRWELNGVDAGGMACFVDSTTGDAILYWSYKDDALLVKATNQKGDSKALYGFFQAVARFINP
jgi:serine/threonine-protein kinase